MERMSDALNQLRKKRNAGKRWSEGRGQTMNRWRLWKADLRWRVRKSAVSQWSRVKQGNESMGVDERRSESALYSLDCQFTSKLSQPSNQPGTFERLLLWLQSVYYSTSTDRVGVRLSRWKCMWCKHTPSSLRLTQCPLYELCWIKFGGKE